MTQNLAGCSSYVYLGKPEQRSKGAASLFPLYKHVHFLTPKLESGDEAQKQANKKQKTKKFKEGKF